MAIAALEPPAQESQFSESTSKRDELGRSDFLEMFITQMQHQDPLNPLESTEFTSQLAQFSSLEQLFNLSENSVKMLEAQEDSARMETVKLIGKEVLAEGNTLSLQEDAPIRGSFLLPETVSTCAVSIHDSVGRLVRTLDLGPLEAGEHDFQWDGLDASGQAVPEKTYTYRINAKDLEGTEVEASTRASGVVTGVKLGDLVPLLYIGDIELPVTQVIEVRPSATPSPE